MDNNGYTGDEHELDSRGPNNKLPPLDHPSHPTSNGYSNGNATEMGKGSSPDGASEEYEQSLRDREPLRFIRWISNRPKTFFFLTLGGHFFFILLSFTLIAGGYNLIPIVIDRIPLDIRSNVDYLHGYAFDNALEGKDVIERGASEGNETLLTEIYDFIMLHFIKEDGNVLTKENLKKIQEIENQFMELKDFREKYCQQDDNGDCFPPDSLIRFFDGSKKNIDAIFDDPEFNNIAGVLHAANTNPLTNVKLRSFMSSPFEITATTAQSTMTRSIIPMGGPLEGYDKVADVEEEGDKQSEKYNTFLVDEVIPLGDKLFKSGVGEMEFTYASGGSIGLWIQSQVIKDLALAVGSLVFIFLFMTFQTRSFWISGWTVFSIMSGFLITNIIYRVIFNFQYLGIFHVLSVFIILGIGADDVFVYMDTWRESGYHSYKSLAHRHSAAYRKAGLAMLYTSLTTAAAFVVSAFSPFLGIYSFGVFSSILIMVNYFSVIIFLPCVINMYHIYFERNVCCCCCPNKDDYPPDYANPKKAGTQKNIIVRFFKGPYLRFITHKIGKWFILAFYIAFLAVFIYFASSLKVNEEQIKFISEADSPGKFLATVRNFASNIDGTQNLIISWGLLEQDMDSCHHTDPYCTGETVFDPDFELRTAEQQNALENFCTTLRRMDEETIKKLRMKVDLNTKIPEVDCFVYELKEFLTEESTRLNENFGYPLDKTQVEALMRSAPQVYKSMPASNNSWIPTGLSYWLYNGMQLDKGMGPQFRDYNKMIGEAKTKNSIKTNIGPLVYYYGTELKWIAIKVNLTINPGNLGYPEGLPIRDEWDNYVKDLMKTMPEGLKNGWQATPETAGEGFDLWHWLKIQEKLVTSAFQGIIIGICVAIPILIIATHNFLVGLLASLTIIMIVTCVIGFIPMCGWKLGLLESLNLVLVVGLAVDYVVHLAEGYARSHKPDRIGRLHDTLEEVGISVLSGALTSLGSSFFLCFARILFFVQFGLFMFSTIGFAILFSLGLFTTLLGILGPQGDTASFKQCKEKCCPCCPGNK